MLSSDTLAILALVIAVISLFLANFHKGKLNFYIPFLKYFYKDNEGHFNISFPVSIWNSGSVARSMNLLVGVVKELEEDVDENTITDNEILEADSDCFFFIMSKYLQGFDIQEADNAPLISSISIELRSSITKLISFKSKDKLFLEDGRYSFELTGHIDGSDVLVRDLLEFEFEINEETHAGLLQNKYHKTLEFNIKEETAMSKKEERKLKIRVIVHLILLFILVILTIVAYSVSSFGDIIVYNENSLEGTFLAILIFLIFLLFVFDYGKYRIKKERITKNV